MIPTSILIQKRDMSGELGLFTQAIAPEAEVFFEGEGANFRASFPHVSPFEGASSFDIPPGGISKQVQQNAVFGVYVLYIEDQNTGKKVHLQLTVVEGGLSYVGLIAEHLVLRSRWPLFSRMFNARTPSVRAQLRQSGGQPFEVQFTKSVVNEPALIYISKPGYEYPEVSLSAEDTELMKALDPPPVAGETVSIRLAGGNPEESGGTEVVDIIVET